MAEKDLIQRLKFGDADAQEELIRVHRRRLLATAWHILGPQDPDAEDAVQETFVSALRAIQGFEGRSSLYTWLNHICVNHCFAIVRKRRRLVATEGADLERLLEPLGREADPGAEAEKRRLAEALDGWIRGLEERCREILALRFREGLALAEIRERLQVPLGTVASRLRPCQEALKARAGKP